VRRTNNPKNKKQEIITEYRLILEMFYEIAVFTTTSKTVREVYLSEDNTETYKHNVFTVYGFFLSPV